MKKADYAVAHGRLCARAEQAILDLIWGNKTPHQVALDLYGALPDDSKDYVDERRPDDDGDEP